MKTDDQLHTDILEKLKFVPNLNESRIIVEVKDGVVTLTGYVGSFLEKKIAERAVQSVLGVKGIAEELSVDLLEVYKRSDADIAKSAVEALKWHVGVPSENIKVTVENGRVTLTGEVDWGYQRENAGKTIRRLYGVTDINNHIKIKPTSFAAITADQIREKLIKEFERNAVIGAQKIRIEVQGSKVILKGNVRSWAEMREATRATWFIPGVTEIENYLAVSSY